MEYIDLKVYLTKLLKNWVIIALCCVIGVCSAFIYSEFFATPMYASSVKLSVYDSVGGASISNVQVSYELVENCLVVLEDSVTFEKVAEIVNEEMGTEYTGGQIGKYVSYSRVGETFFMTVNVKSPNPELSAVICNAVVAIAPDLIMNYVANIPVVALDEARINYNPVSPDTMKNMIIGFLLAFVGVCAVLFLVVFFDNTVSDEEKLKERYDLSVLGVVPNMDVNIKGYRRIA